MPFTNHYVSCSAGITTSKECLPEGVFKQFTPTVLETAMGMILMLWGKKFKKFPLVENDFSRKYTPLFFSQIYFLFFLFIKTLMQGFSKIKLDFPLAFTPVSSLVWIKNTE